MLAKCLNRTEYVRFSGCVCFKTTLLLLTNLGHFPTVGSWAGETNPRLSIEYKLRIQTSFCFALGFLFCSVLFVLSFLKVTRNTRDELVSEVVHLLEESLVNK